MRYYATVEGIVCTHRDWKPNKNVNRKMTLVPCTLINEDKSDGFSTLKLNAHVSHGQTLRIVLTRMKNSTILSEYLAFTSLKELKEHIRRNREDVTSKFWYGH